MSTRLSPFQIRAPFKTQVRLGGKVYVTTVDPVTRRRFVGDYELDAFIERAQQRGEVGVLADLRRVNWPEMDDTRRSLLKRGINPFALHQARARRF